MLELSNLDARRLLVSHHLKQDDIRGVFERLGSVQYDPLNPVGRNHDLVLQARVPNYQVGDWERQAYQERFIYDAWDKQASLVKMDSWPFRRIYHKWHAKRWEKDVLIPYKKTVPKVLAELTDRGPLTSSAFEYQPHVSEWEGSWHGPKLTKNILRALWHTGNVVTHSRKRGHHVYDLAEHVIPETYFKAKPLSDTKALEALIKLRHKAMGLLRPNASYEVWSFGVGAHERKSMIASLVDRGELVPVKVDGVLFHATPDVFNTLEQTAPCPRMTFIAPLDQLVWDRKAVAHIFDFDYLWEVYKPEKDRKWGYYVLPVVYGDSFVARFDSRFKDGVLTVHAWYWEKDGVKTPELFEALEDAVTRFKGYLGAEKIVLPKGLDKLTCAAWQAGAA